nr:PIN domain-containing protein [uncultured Gellertiella sp.]
MKIYVDANILSGETPISVSPLTRSIYRLSARLRATNNSLKLPDALYIATARSIGCTHFLTADDGVNDVILKRFEATDESLAPPLAIIRPDLPTLDSLLKSPAP